MNKWYALSLVAAVVVCAGAVGLLGGPPALLDNDLGLDDGMAPAGTVSILDEAVPLADLPAEAAAAEPPAEAAADPYEGLDEKQIEYVEEVLKLVNEARVEAGVAPLELDPALRKAAQVRAAECVGTFSHTRPDGTLYKTAITEAGLTPGYSGENAATGHSSAEQVVEGWLKSDGHRANILSERFTKIGIGLQKNTGNRYRGYAWVQLFTD